LEVDAGLAAFACTTDIGRVKLSTRLVGGAYPSIRTAIPSEVTYRFEMDRKELMQSVKRASLLWDSGVKLVTLQFDESQENVTVFTSSDIGDTNEELPISWKSGSDAFKVALNGVLFMESLKQISTNRVSIDGTTKDKPILLRPVDSDIDHLVLLMPLAVLGR
jgi:DNA polymerase-3 subunit beta